MLPRILGMINQIIIENRKANQYPPITQIETVYGNRAVEFNGHTPRLVWTFGRDRYTQTKHIGNNPHQGRSLEAEVFCHIFGNTPDDVYNLANDVISAVRQVVHDPGLLSASGELLDVGEISQNGYGYRLAMVIDVTSIDPGLPYVNIEHVAPTAIYIDIQPS